MNQVPQPKRKIIIRLGEKGASAYLEDKILVEKKQLKELVFFLWENYQGYKLEFIGIKPQDYVFATFSDIKCWDMFSIEDHNYPVVPIEIQNQQGTVRIFALVDTAASIVLLDNSLKDLFVTEKIGKKRVITPLGEGKFEIHLIEYGLSNISVKCESIFVDLPSAFKNLEIQAIIGENLLKNKNILVLYLRNVTCISD